MNIAIEKLVKSKAIEAKWGVVFLSYMVLLENVIEELGVEDIEISKDALILEKHRRIIKGSGVVGNVDR